VLVYVFVAYYHVLTCCIRPSKLTTSPEHGLRESLGR
jgi:hypothetical protein